jgi:hypothetical protein
MLDYFTINSPTAPETMVRASSAQPSGRDRLESLDDEDVKWSEASLRELGPHSGESAKRRLHLGPRAPKRILDMTLLREW